MKLVLTLFAFMMACVAQAKTITLDKSRLIEIIDEVDGSMLEVAQKIDKMSAAGDKNIDILINSPGGSVFVGTTILDSMALAKARGVTIRCVVGSLAASMAFVILTDCDERYALANAKLLFHPVSTGGQGRLQELLITMKVVENLEQGIMAKLQRSMNLEWKKFHMFYFSEVLWHASQLAEHTGGNGRWLTIVDNITGTDKLFVVQRERRGLFGVQPRRSQQVVRVLKKLEGDNDTTN
jgi:ATP-dependent protease ClpP protease subunit